MSAADAIRNGSEERLIPIIMTILNLLLVPATSSLFAKWLH